MERAFRVTSESEYYKALKRYEKRVLKQKEYVKKFCEEQGIKSKLYYVGGDGLVNKAFKESEIKDINFYIVPTKEDIEKFGDILLTPDSKGLRRFRKNSKIARDFARMCVDNEIVINPLEPSLRYYFTSIGYAGFYRSLIESGDSYYLVIGSDRLENTDIPKGFKPIKISEFYLIKESLEENDDK